MGLLSRLNPFRRSFIAVVPESPDKWMVIGRARLTEDADLTLFEHDGQVELLWIDMDAEDAESFLFQSEDEARAFAVDRFGVSMMTGHSHPEV